MQDESRSMGDVAINMDSQANPMQLQLIDEQVNFWKIFMGQTNGDSRFLNKVSLLLLCSALSPV